MRRPLKIAIWVVGALLALVLILVTSGVYIARTEWLREKVRERIVAEVENATGGKVEIGRFRFDWKTLTAELDDFVLHGTEPTTGKPLMRIKTLVVGLKIISLWKKDFDIALLRVEQPQAFLLIAADGSTNVPNPKTVSKSSKSGVETILDLKIQQFALNNGSAEIHAAGQPPKTSSYDAAGQNLQSKFLYEAAAPDYKGTLSVHPLELRYGPDKPIPVNIDAAVAIEKNRMRIESAKVETPSSNFSATGTMESFTSPVFNAQFSGAVSVAEVGNTLKLKTRQSGTVELGGSARYASTTDYLVAANVHAKDLAYSQPGIALKNVRADAALRVDPKLVNLEGIRIAALGGDVTGNAELREFDAFSVKGKLAHFDIRQLAALATKTKLPYDGLLNGPFEARGRLSDTKQKQLLATTRLAITPARGSTPVTGLIDARYEGARDLISLGNSYLALPNSRVDLSGVLGQQLKIHAETRNLDDFTAAAAPQKIPVTLQQGALTFDGTVTGALASPKVAGHFTGRNFVYSGETISALDADIAAQSTGATVDRATVAYKTLRGSFNGTVGLKNWSPENYEPVTANLTLQNAQIADLLLLAGQKGIPVTGTLNTTAQVSGTLGNPRATANLSVVSGSAYDEPFDRITGRVDYLNGGTQVATAQMKAGLKQIDLKATYTHAPTDFLTGKLQFETSSNRMMLNQFVTVRKLRPGVNGAVQLTASGDVAVSQQPKTGAKIEIGSVNADVSATGIVLDGRSLGDAKLTARTQGQTITAHLESDVAQSTIRGDGQVALTGDYQSKGSVTFTKVDLATVRRLAMPPTPSQTMQIGGSIEGRVDFNGPAAKPELMTARLEIPKLEVRPDPLPAAVKQLGDVTIRNAEPIRISLANQVIRVESAKLTAHNTNFQLAGQVRLLDKEPLALRATGALDLSLAQTFDTDVTASGSLAVNVDVRGSFDAPQLTGRADLKNGNVSLAGVPNGIFEANGHILFDGSRATIETLTAKTGGGNLKMDGFAAFGGATTSFRLGVAATGVRVRYPEGVSSVSDTNISLTGTTERSVLAGSVIINKLSYNPSSDLGSLLQGSSTPATAPTAQTGFLGGMQFDVRIQTSPDVQFQTGLVEDLQTEADLRLRGTATNPALLGRVIIDQGNLNFFGNKYVINQGTISFYNPVKIEPIVNIDLETKARGVDVTLTVSGPMTKLNVTYRSDPPLQFSDIVGLLATGKTPSDPTLAARQPDTTQQSWQQLGANAIVGSAIANPVAGRLQRFFGVSKLKIDPILPGLGGGGSAGGSPGARLSVEQQVTPNIIFDYVINTNSTSSQLVRVEWDFSKNWSAVILREENSAFGIDFLYKKRFK